MKVRVGAYDDGATLWLETESVADQMLLRDLLTRCGRQDLIEAEYPPPHPRVTIIQPLTVAVIARTQ